MRNRPGGASRPARDYKTYAGPDQARRRRSTSMFLALVLFIALAVARMANVSLWGRSQERDDAREGGAESSLAADNAASAAVAAASPKRALRDVSIAAPPPPAAAVTAGELEVDAATTATDADAAVASTPDPELANPSAVDLSSPGDVNSASSAVVAPARAFDLGSSAAALRRQAAAAAAEATAVENTHGDTAAAPGAEGRRGVGRGGNRRGPRAPLTWLQRLAKLHSNLRGTQSETREGDGVSGSGADPSAGSSSAAPAGRALRASALQRALRTLLPPPQRSGARGGVAGGVGGDAAAGAGPGPGGARAGHSSHRGGSGGPGEERKVNGAALFIACDTHTGDVASEWVEASVPSDVTTDGAPIDGAAGSGSGGDDPLISFCGAEEDEVCGGGAVGERTGAIKAHSKRGAGGGSGPADTPAAADEDAEAAAVAWADRLAARDDASSRFVRRASSDSGGGGEEEEEGGSGDPLSAPIPGGRFTRLAALLSGPLNGWAGDQLTALRHREALAARRAGQHRAAGCAVPPGNVSGLPSAFYPDSWESPAVASLPRNPEPLAVISAAGAARRGFEASPPAPPVQSLGDTLAEAWPLGLLWPLPSVVQSGCVEGGEGEDEGGWGGGAQRVLPQWRGGEGSSSSSRGLLGTLWSNTGGGGGGDRLPPRSCIDVRRALARQRHTGSEGQQQGKGMAYSRAEAAATAAGGDGAPAPDALVSLWESAGLPSPGAGMYADPCAPPAPLRMPRVMLFELTAATTAALAPRGSAPSSSAAAAAAGSGELRLLRQSVARTCRTMAASTHTRILQTAGALSAHLSRPPTACGLAGQALARGGSGGGCNPIASAPSASSSASAAVAATGAGGGDGSAADGAGAAVAPGHTTRDNTGETAAATDAAGEARRAARGRRREGRARVAALHARLSAALGSRGSSTGGGGGGSGSPPSPPTAPLLLRTVRIQVRGPDPEGSAPGSGPFPTGRTLGAALWRALPGHLDLGATTARMARVESALWDEAGEGPGAGGDNSTAHRAQGAGGNPWAGLPVPHQGMDEAYGLEIGGRAAAVGGSPGTVGAVVTAHQVWGALRGLNTLASSLEGLGVSFEEPPGALGAEDGSFGDGGSPPSLPLSPPPVLLHPYHAVLEALGAVLSETPHRDAAHLSPTSPRAGHPAHPARRGSHSGRSTDAAPSAPPGPPWGHIQLTLTPLQSAVGRLASDLCAECALTALEALLTQLEGESEAGGNSPLSLLTLLDATQPSPSLALPLIVADRPWRTWRGFLLDSARHWLPLPSIRRTIDAMAVSGLNLLHWHLVDSQAWPIDLASAPEMAPKRSWHYPDMTYTRSHLRSIVRYAARRGIRVVPELDTPSHARVFAALEPPLATTCGVGDECGIDRGYPGKGGSPAGPASDFTSGEPGGLLDGLDTSACLRHHNKAVVDPSLDASYALISGLYAELATLFPDGAMHVGADEVDTGCLKPMAGGLDPRDWALRHLHGLIMPPGHRACAMAPVTLGAGGAGPGGRLTPFRDIVSQGGAPPPSSDAGAAAATAYFMRAVVKVVSGALGKSPASWGDAQFELWGAGERGQVGSCPTDPAPPAPPGLGETRAWWPGTDGAPGIGTEGLALPWDRQRPHVDELTLAPLVEAGLLPRGFGAFPSAPSAFASLPPGAPSLGAPLPPPVLLPPASGTGAGALDLDVRPFHRLSSYASPPKVALQAWKCWNKRYEPELLRAGEDDLDTWAQEDATALAAALAWGLLGNGSTPSSSGSGGDPWGAGPEEWLARTAPRGLADLRGLLQSACWYLDDSANTWAGVFSHWAPPSFEDTMRRLGDLLCAAQPGAQGACAHLPASGGPPGNASPRLVAALASAVAAEADGSGGAAARAEQLSWLYTESASGDAPPPSAPPGPSAPLWPLVLGSPWPFWGGEASAWSEELDAINLDCRAWPRAAVVGELLASESLAFDRYARAVRGSGGAGNWGSFPWARENEGVVREQHAFVAPRLLLQGRRLWSSGVFAEATAVFEMGAARGLGLALSQRAGSPSAPGSPYPSWDVLSGPGPLSLPLEAKPMITSQQEITGYDGFCPAHFTTPRHRRASSQVANRLVLWQLRLGGEDKQSMLGAGRDQTVWLRDSGAETAILFHHDAAAIVGKAAAVAGAPGGVGDGGEGSVPDSPLPSGARLSEALTRDAHEHLPGAQGARMRFIGGRNSFPFSFALPAHHGTAIYLLSTAPIAVIHASRLALVHGLLVADTLGVRHIVASFSDGAQAAHGQPAAPAAAGGPQLSVPLAEARIVTALVRQYSPLLPLVVSGRCGSSPHAHTVPGGQQQQHRNCSVGAVPGGGDGAAAARAAYCSSGAVQALLAEGSLFRMPAFASGAGHGVGGQGAAAPGVGVGPVCEGEDDLEHGAAAHGVTFVLVNRAFLESTEGGPGAMGCAPQHTGGGAADHDHDPLLCRWRN